MSEDIHKWTDGKYTLMFDEHTFFVFDNEKEKRMTALQVTKKLNEQQDTIGEQKIAIDELITDYKKLEKENERLKEELQRFKKYVFSQDTILCYKCEHCIKKDIYVVDCEMKGEVDVHGICSLFREVKV